MHLILNNVLCVPGDGAIGPEYVDGLQQNNAKFNQTYSPDILLKVYTSQYFRIHVKYGGERNVG